MRRAELVGILIFLLLGIHVVQQASLLPYEAKYGPGPGFLPFWLGWCWVGLALIHFVNLTLQPQLYQGQHPFPSGTGAARVAAVYGILLGGIFLLGSMGILIALTLMVVAILLGVERMPRVSSLVVAICVSVVFYYLFAVVLSVPFPRGPLGI